MPPSIGRVGKRRLENRLDGLGDDNMSEKARAKPPSLSENPLETQTLPRIRKEADRAELHRLDLAVQELQQSATRGWRGRAMESA